MLDFPEFRRHSIMSKLNWGVVNERCKIYSGFKAEAIKQITERGHGVVEVSKRLGVSDKSL